MREKYAPFPLAFLSTLCMMNYLLQYVSVKYQVNLFLAPVDISVLHCTQHKAMEKFATVFLHILNPSWCATLYDILGFTAVDMQKQIGMNMIVYLED